MLDDTQLERSKSIQQRTGRTFHVATRVLPPEHRTATYALYAFFRIADDVVDDANPPPPAEQRARLDEIRRAALGETAPEDPALKAFQQVREEHDIPDREIEEFMAAMAADVEHDRFETYVDLEDYLRGSSVAVAYMMVHVMDPDEAALARPHAKSLGEALQLTNFLRDVREDVLNYGRVYLPETTLARHGVSREQIERLEFSEDFAAVMRDELARTERLYRHGVAGIEYLPSDCQFAVLTAAVLYADHHRLIREQGYDVLSERPSLSTRRRLSLLARTWLALKRTGDPVAAFETVTDLETDEDRSRNETDTGRVRDAGSRRPRLRDSAQGLAAAVRSRLRPGASE